MKKLPLTSFMIAFILTISYIGAYAQRGIAYPVNKKKPSLIIYSSGKVENYKNLATRIKAKGEQPTATFEVTYSGFSEEAKVAFQTAVDLWSYLIASPVPIKVNASWEPLIAGVLGSASASSFRRDFKNAPYTSTWYPIAIANKNAGFDIEPGTADITANFSSLANWYLGTDGICPVTKTDFISVVMHELCHGLGFVGSASTNNDKGSWGYDTNFPFIYDRFIYNKEGQQIIDTLLFENPSEELKDQLTSGKLTFVSELSNKINGDKPVSIYAPLTWNDGSSYSHLGQTFNATPNSMMTYSVGTGEVMHDPGPVVLTMFAEMGWMNVNFFHMPHKDIEVFDAPININTTIISDSSLIAESVKLHYSFDNFVTDSIVTMISTNDSLYSAEIPVLATDSIYYYIEATTSVGRTHHYPAQGNGNISPEVSSVFSFSVGALDTIPPVITHQNEQSIFLFRNVKIEYQASDNLGLNDAYIEYKINNGELNTIKSEKLGYSELDETYAYSSEIDISNLNDNDILSYRIIVKDSSLAANTTTLPADNFFDVSIIGLMEPVVEDFINFDDNGANLIGNKGLAIQKPVGFENYALHSPHPYLEGDAFPDDEINYSAFLKKPVILKENDAIIRFDEIVIVEPGETGSEFGSSDFWDYVVIEGSTDSVKTWHEFEDGYDSRINSDFKRAYDKSNNGDQSMYVQHTIDMLANDYFKPGDEVIIRFRLYSDQLSFGWGWAVDNIEIQPNLTAINEITKKEAIKLYPNPTTDILTVDANIEGMEEFDLGIYSLLGECLYKKHISNNVIKIDLSTYKEGIYLIKLDYGDSIITKKIIKE